MGIPYANETPSRYNVSQFGTFYREGLIRKRKGNA